MYYSQCHRAAEETVRHWFSDVTDHDRLALQGYEGAILYAVRDTGTNLIRLTPERPGARAALWLSTFFFSADNERFFSGVGGALNEVTRETARDIWDTYIKGA